MMKSSYKDRELPEAFKKNMKKKADKEARYGSAKECPKCKGDKKKCPGGKACPMAAKKDMGRSGPYADGMCGRRGDIANAFSEVLIEDDEEVERADKPCGRSHIPEKAKCTKQTTLRPPTRKKKKSTNYAGNVARILGNTVASGVAYAALGAGVRAITGQVAESRKRSRFLSTLKQQKQTSNLKYGLEKIKYRGTVGLNNSTLKDPSQRMRANKWAEQSLKEAGLKRKRARTEMKLAVNIAKKNWPKSTARKRKG